MMPQTRAHMPMIQMMLTRPAAGPDEHQDAEQYCQCAADDAPDPSAVGYGAMSDRCHDLQDADDDGPNADEDHEDPEAHARPDKDEDPEEDADRTQHDPQPKRRSQWPGRLL